MSNATMNSGERDTAASDAEIAQPPLSLALPMIGGGLGAWLSVGRRVAVGVAGEGSPVEPGVIRIVGVAVGDGPSAVLVGM
jgi:hypothetical protein